MPRSLLALLMACTGLLAPAAALAASFQVSPAEVQLKGNFDRAQLLVTRIDPAAADAFAADRAEDLTGQAKYTSSDANIVSVSETGRLLAVGNGSAKIAVAVGSETLEVHVTVSDVVENPAIGYLEHVAPVISKLGCNMAACHASQHGKGGFKLSVFNHDPGTDRSNIVRDRQQRRVDFLAPEKSLLLRKPTFDVPHGGGRRLVPGSVEYQIIAAWIRAGAPAPNANATKLTKLEVLPPRRLGKIGLAQQLRVVAHFADGQSRDITAISKYDSMDDGVLKVDRDGRVTTVGHGQAPVMVRYEGQAQIAMFVVPYAENVTLAGWENKSYVDELAAAKFRQLGIEPTGLCDDATFLRRAYLDAVGTLPSADETRAFLDSTDPAKRDKLVDRLLGLTGDPAQDVYNDAYAAWWTLKWSDLIRNNSDTVGEQGMWAMHNWIKENFRVNRPFDQFVRELITAKGSIYTSGPANYFRINRDSSALTESTAQLFLGVRLECAKCHHHPFEKYSQDDYYGFAAFFSRVGLKGSQEFGLFGQEQIVVVRDAGEVNNPRSGQRMKPTPLDAEAVDDPLDRRIPLAAWLASPTNELFARSVVNRYMGYLLGHGLVEPVDDMRSTNPPSNVELMDALAKEFAGGGYNVKKLMRTIMTSRLYQLDSRPTEANAKDRRFYSHFKVKRLPAEPLLDAVDRVTETTTKFRNLPAGTRAIELPDAEYPDYFLNTFAKPRRASVCECERVATQNLTQVLHMLNGDIVAGKIASGGGRVARLAAAKKPHAEIVDELYLAALCRHATPEEIKAAEEFLADGANPTEVYQDLLWALLNSKEFLFVH